MTRVEFSIGAWGARDFESVEGFVAAQGTGSGSVLYKNFKALRDTLGVVDAINFDDESNYDVDSTARLGVMLADLGFKVTFAPYTQPSFWEVLYSQLNRERPGLVDRVLLQVSAGGAGNAWNSRFGGLRVEPGLWSRHGPNCSEGATPQSVNITMSSWEASIAWFVSQARAS